MSGAEPATNAVLQGSRDGDSKSGQAPVQPQVDAEHLSANGEVLMRASLDDSHDHAHSDAPRCSLDIHNMRKRDKEAATTG